MNFWVLVIIALIIGSTVYSYWKQISYSIVASVTCGIAFGILVFAGDPQQYLNSDLMYNLEFTPHDLADPTRAYTLFTSMYTHAGFLHLFFNVVGLAFIGMLFEQRVGTRSFIIIYLLTGVCGTLTFAAVRWNDPLIAVVGASGAISGVLGAFARLFPNERLSMILFFFPLPPMPTWIIVIVFVLLQGFFLYGEPNIAVESHLGGLVAGLLLAPIVVKMQRKRTVVRRAVPHASLKKLATTPELKSILIRIEDEEIPEVRSAWIQEFLAKARCPSCGAKLRVSRDSVQCERGHIF
jgi:membrane associated rhomboid family serine protease